MGDRTNTTIGSRHLVDLSNREIVDIVRYGLDELRWRIWNYLETGAHSRDALEEGLLLAVKSHRLVVDAYWGRHRDHVYGLDRLREELEAATIREPDQDPQPPADPQPPDEREAA